MVRGRERDGPAGPSRGRRGTPPLRCGAVSPWPGAGPDGGPPVTASGRPAPVRWGLPDFVLVFLAGVVVSVIATSVYVSAAGVPVADAARDPATTVAALAGQFVGFVGALVAVSRAKGRASLRLDFGWTVRWRDAGFVLLGLVVAVVSAQLLQPIADLADYGGQEVVSTFERSSGPAMVLYAAGVLIVAPVGEELVFRGILLRSLLRRVPAGPAVLIGGLVFGAAHVVGDPGSYPVLPVLVALGTLSGYLAVTSGSLSRSVFLHAGFNLLATIAILTG